MTSPNQKPKGCGHAYPPERPGKGQIPRAILCFRGRLSRQTAAQSQARPIIAMLRTPAGRQTMGLRSWPAHGWQQAIRCGGFLARCFRFRRKTGLKTLFRANRTRGEVIRIKGTAKLRPPPWTDKKPGGLLGAAEENIRQRRPRQKCLLSRRLDAYCAGLDSKGLVPRWRSIFHKVGGAAHSKRHCCLRGHSLSIQG